MWHDLNGYHTSSTFALYVIDTIGLEPMGYVNWCAGEPFKIICTGDLCKTAITLILAALQLHQRTPTCCGSRLLLPCWLSVMVVIVRVSGNVYRVECRQDLFFHLVDTVIIIQ